MSDTLRALLIGDVTIDCNRMETGSYNGPGGSIYFGGKTFLNLGDRLTIVSPYGRDFPREVLGQTEWIPAQSAFIKTLMFQNIYYGNGERQQSVEVVGQTSSFFQEYVTDDIFAKKDIIFVAPLIPDIETDVFHRMTSTSHGLKILLPQGMYRRVNPDGTISPIEWKDELAVMPRFDIVVFSEKDLLHWEQKAKLWSRKESIIVVTQAQRGCIVFEKGRGTHIPAFRVFEIVDSTGSGDIFAAAFAHAFLHSQNTGKSALFANACAGLALRFSPKGLQYTLEEIYSFARSQGRDLQL